MTSSGSYELDRANLGDQGGDTEHQKMVLQSRNGQGIWEPKVASGTGYTVRTQPTTTTEPPFIKATGMRVI